MRRSAGLLIPRTIIFSYYAFWIALVWFVLRRYPGLAEYFPVGGISELVVAQVGEEVRLYTRDLQDSAILNRARSTTALAEQVG